MASSAAPLPGVPEHAEMSPPASAPPSLPDSLLSFVFSHLSSSSLCSLSGVCREWREVSRDAWLWKQWFLARYPDTRLTKRPTHTSNGEEEQDETHREDDEEEDAWLHGRLGETDLLDSECVGTVPWRAAYRARSDVSTWSAQLFTPPRRRVRPSSPLVERADNVSPGPYNGSVRGTPRVERSLGGGPSSSPHSASDRGGLVRSRSSNSVQEARGSGGGGGRRGSATEDTAPTSPPPASSATPVLNNHTPLPTPRPHSARHVKHSSSPALHGRRAPRTPVLAAKSPALPPAFPSPHLTSPLIGGSNSTSAWSAFDELDLGSSSSSASVDGGVVGGGSQPLLLTGHRGAVTCLRFDSSRLALASGRDVRVHSLRTGALLDSVRVLPAASSSHGLVTGLDLGARVLVAAATDCAIRTYDLDTMSCTRVTAKKSAHTDVVTCVRLSSNERGVTSASLDGTLKVFDVEGGACLRTLNASDSSRLGMLLCMESLDEHTYLCGTASGDGARVALFDVRAAEREGLIHALQVRDNTFADLLDQPRTPMICSVSHARDTHAFVAGGSDGSVQVYDLRTMGEGRAPIIVGVPPLAASSTTSSSSSSHLRPPRSTSPFVTATPSPPSDSFMPSASGATSSGSGFVDPTVFRPGPPVQSVHLDATRLLVCQKRCVSIYSASALVDSVSSSGSGVDGVASEEGASSSRRLPFAHMVHRVTLEDAAAWSHSSLGGTGGATAATSMQTPPRTSAAATPPHLFHYMHYDEPRGIMALATTDACMVWMPQRRVFEL